MLSLFSGRELWQAIKETPIASRNERFGAVVLLHFVYAALSLCLS